MAHGDVVVISHMSDMPTWERVQDSLRSPAFGTATLTPGLGRTHLQSAGLTTSTLSVIHVGRFVPGRPDHSSETSSRHSCQFVYGQPYQAQVRSKAQGALHSVTEFERFVLTFGVPI
jgi:hypothetical protein